MLWHIILVLLPVIYGIPISYFLREVAESAKFDDFENYLPSFADIPSFEILANDLDVEKAMMKNIKNGENLESISEMTQLPLKPSSTVSTTEEVSTIPMEQSQLNSTTTVPDDGNSTETPDTPDFSVDFSLSLNETSRFPRQELNDTEDDPEFSSKEKESREEGSEEGNGNMITGLLSAFLGGLSRPDGSIDLEAIIGLLGSLSTQNPDGSYDFQGLTDLLRGFFGGDEEGGSDIGAFVGGLIGATIKGVANPPGPKGAGILTGKIVAGVLPALSAPVDDTDMMATGKPPQKAVLDSGSFLGGILKTILGSSSGQGGGGGVNIVQSIFTSVKSLFTSSSKSH